MIQELTFKKCDLHPAHNQQWYKKENEKLAIKIICEDHKVDFTPAQNAYLGYIKYTES